MGDFGLVFTYMQQCITLHATAKERGEEAATEQSDPPPINHDVTHLFEGLPQSSEMFKDTNAARRKFRESLKSTLASGKRGKATAATHLETHEAEYRQNSTSKKADDEVTSLIDQIRAELGGGGAKK